MDRSLEEDFGDFVDAASPRLLGLAWNLGGVEHEARTWCRPSSGSMSGGGRWSFPPRSWLRRPVSGRGRTGHRGPGLRAPPARTRERQVVVLRYYADQSERTVADRLGVTTGTVKAAAHRGLAKLREAPTEGEHSHVKP